MKFYKHSNGEMHLYPEVVPAGMEFVLMLDKDTIFRGEWRKIKCHSQD